MSQSTLAEKTTVYRNGIITVYHDDDGWHYIATSNSKTVRTDETFINWQSARANAYLAMQKEHNIELKGRES